MFDSDTTLVGDFQENKYRKKPYKNQTGSAENGYSQPSESLIKVKKKKYSEIARGSHLKNVDLLIKKKNPVSVDFLTQDIFKQSSSEDFINSTPKRSKKRNKELNINDSDNGLSPMKKVKQEKEQNSTINSLDDLNLTKKHKKKKSKELDSSNIDQTKDTVVDFCTQNIFKQPNSEDFENSTLKTPKKKKNKELKINGNDGEDSRIGTNEFRQENNVNSATNGLDDAHLEPFIKKEKNDSDEKLNSSLTGQNSDLKHADENSELSDSWPLDRTDVSELHHSSNISSDDSKVFSKFKTGDINLPCSHKEKRKTKTMKTDRTSTLRKSALKEKDSLKDDFFCQFCNSSVSNVNNDDNNSFNNNGILHDRASDIANGRNGLKSCNENIKKTTKNKNKSICTASINRKKGSSLLYLVEKYLDNNLDNDSDSSSLLTDDSLSIFDISEGHTLSDSEDVNGSADNRNSPISVNKSIDTVKKNEATADDRSSPKTVNKNIDEVKKKKRKHNESLNDSSRVNVNISDDGNNPISGNKSIDIGGEEEATADDRNSPKISNKNIDAVNKKTRKHKKSFNDSRRVNVNISDNTFSSSLPTSSLNKAYDNSICSQDILGNESLPVKNDNTSKNSSGRSNGNPFAYSSDSDEGVDEKIDKLVDRMQLKCLEIKIDFPVPKLHEICNRASKPTPGHRLEIAKENIALKNGKFIKAEDAQIKENWQKFIKMYNLKDKPEVFFSLNRKYIPLEQKRNFLFFLARGLNERTPFSVYQRFKLLMSQMKRGRFTENEDAYILSQMEKTGCARNYMVNIAAHLQRPLHSIEKRIKRLRDKHTRKIRWKNRNLTAFIKYLLKVTRTDSNDLEKLKNRKLLSEEWRRLSRKLDGIPIRILKQAWLEKIYPMLFIPHKVCDLRQVKLDLINMFYANAEHEWRAVNWKNYASHFEGLTPLRIYSIMKTLVSSKVPPSKRSNLKKCIKVLRTLTIVDLAPHFIYKVKYVEGKIVHLAKKKTKGKRK